MSEYKCNFCNDTNIIEFKAKEHENKHPILIEWTCPCVEIKRQKFKADQFKALAMSINTTLQGTCEIVAKLMPSGWKIANDASKFIKSQIKLIEEL